MKTYLLPEKGKFYKANLHSHSTFSDGKLTPQQIKEEYMKKGYSVVAYTDHDLLIPHQELTDENFVALNGYEIGFCEIYESVPYEFCKQCHVVLIGLDKDNVYQPLFLEKRHAPYNTKYIDLVKSEGTPRILDKWYSPSCISFTMETARKKGFYVIYAHPTWSLESYNQYVNYNGMHAVEIVNGCVNHGFDDVNPRVYDELLRSGKKISCIATDDNHNTCPIDSPYTTSFAGFTMIKADKLEYNTITKAMVDGNFYCSQGPEIYELYIEDGKLVVKCSDAQRINVNYAGRLAQTKVMEDAPVTEAEFELSNKHGYFRVTVIGLDGKRAFTNAYYPEDYNI